MQKQYVLEDYLQHFFHYDTFRPGQKEIVSDIMQGKSVLGILPTGSGKSLCYQLPSLLLPGLTIVVSPLISLMIDQVRQLKAARLKQVCALNSFMDFAERKRVYQQLHTYKLIYVSPELLQNKELLSHLKRVSISLFVIDEAHCISQWGHEFRPDYLKLHQVITLLAHPPVLALSATATKHVQEDIITSLRKPEMVNHIYPMDRENIAYCVQEAENDAEKQDIITRILSDHHVPALIYFSSRFTAEQTAHVLLNKLPKRRIAFYHGGMDQTDRIAVQQQFMNGQLDVICCTSAFGMGINKTDIRLVIHYHFPAQIESYIQEVGRAGRDGKSSAGLLLFSKGDYYIPKNLIQNELPEKLEMESAFRQLAYLYKQGKHLPSGEREQANLFQLSEIKWRFLHFQFEKHGMIADNIINFDENSWKKTFQGITAVRKERIRLKEGKLHEMIRWIQEGECLRKHLYKPFQPSFTKPAIHCCSNCGFIFSEWKPEQTPRSDSTPSSWKEKLQRLLLIGDRTVNGAK